MRGSGMWSAPILQTRMEAGNNKWHIAVASELQSTAVDGTLLHNETSNGIAGSFGVWTVSSQRRAEAQILRAFWRGYRPTRSTEEPYRCCGEAALRHNDPQENNEGFASPREVPR